MTQERVFIVGMSREGKRQRLKRLMSEMDDQQLLHDLLGKLSQEQYYKREAIKYVEILFQQTAGYKEQQVPILFAVKELLESLLFRQADEKRWDKEER